MPRTHLHIFAIAVLAAVAAAADAAPKRKRSRRAPATAMTVARSEALAKQVDARTTIAVVTVRKRPGERQAAAGTLPAGTEVVVVGEHGRWLRVRAGRITGYVTRTTVSAPRVTRSPSDDADASRAQLAAAPASDPDGLSPTSWRMVRDRETSKTATSALLATVIAQSAALRAEPDAAAHVVATIAKGQRVVVVEARETPGWIQVRDRDGHAGWIAQRELGDDPDMSDGGGAGEARPRTLSAVTTTRIEPDVERRRAWSLHLAAGAGYRALATRIESTGAERNIAGRASVARLELDATVAVLQSMFIGADAHVEAGRSAARLDASGAGAIYGTRGLAAGVRVGFRPRALAQLSVRAGTRRETVQVMAGAAAAEQLAGTTLGVRFDVAPRRSRLSARIEVDTLVAGTWQHGEGQTRGPARAMWAGMTIAVRIVGPVSLQAAFELGRASTAWSEMTMTERVGARRGDASQLLQVGLSGAL